jgi:hypothetical protein
LLNKRDIKIEHEIFKSETEMDKRFEWMKKELDVLLESLKTHLTVIREKIIE